MNTWRRGFVEAAKASIDALFKEFPTYFCSAEKKGATVEFWLTKTHDEETFVFQWRDYDITSEKRKVWFLFSI